MKNFEIRVESLTLELIVFIRLWTYIFWWPITIYMKKKIIITSIAIWQWMCKPSKAIFIRSYIYFLISKRSVFLSQRETRSAVWRCLYGYKHLSMRFCPYSFDAFKTFFFFFPSFSFIRSRRWLIRLLYTNGNAQQVPIPQSAREWDREREREIGLYDWYILQALLVHIYPLRFNAQNFDFTDRARE